MERRHGRLDVLVNNAGVTGGVTLATVAPDGPTGGYFDRTGPLPW